MASPSVLVPEESLDKFRSMGWSTALLFLTPAMISCLVQTSERSSGQFKDNMDALLSALELGIALTHVYLFWRVLFICSDEEEISDTLRVPDGDSKKRTTSGP